MTENDLRNYNVYGELEADRYILNEMLNNLQNKEGFDFDYECQAAKMYKSEAEAVKRWHYYTNTPPVNEIYRLLGHLQYEYKEEYREALLSYIKSSRHF